MNIKRAIVIGIALWVTIFFEVSILMFGFGLTTGTLYYVLHYIIVTIFLVVATLFYFKKKKGSWKEGLLFGIVGTITGIILDALITVPLFVKDYSQFFSLSMLFGYTYSLAIPTIVGALKKK